MLKFRNIIAFLLMISFLGISLAESFSVSMWSALSGNSTLDIYYYYQYLKKKFGEPYQRKDGAFWFKASESFYSLKTEDVFVSDGSSDYIFIGISVSGSPESTVKAVSFLPGFNFYKENPNDQYSKYIANSGAEVLWFGADKSKIVFVVKSSMYKFN